MYALAFYQVTVQKVGNLCLSMYKNLVWHSPCFWRGVTILNGSLQQGFVHTRCLNLNRSLSRMSTLVKLSDDGQSLCLRLLYFSMLRETKVCSKVAIHIRVLLYLCVPLKPAVMYEYDTLSTQVYFEYLSLLQL